MCALVGWRFLCVCAFDGFLLWVRIASACPTIASLCNRVEANLGRYTVSPAAKVPSKWGIYHHSTMLYRTALYTTDTAPRRTKGIKLCTKQISNTECIMLMHDLSVSKQNATMDQMNLPFVRASLYPRQLSYELITTSHACCHTFTTENTPESSRWNRPTLSRVLSGSREKKRP